MEDRYVIKAVQPPVGYAVGVVLLLCSSGYAHAFDYFEHRYLGNYAYEEAVRVLPEDLPLVKDLREVEQDLGFAGVVSDICKANKEADETQREDLRDKLTKRGVSLQAIAEQLAALPMPVCEDTDTTNYNLREPDPFLLRMIPLRFGDIAALAADHAETEEELRAMLDVFRHPAKTRKDIERVVATRRHIMNACRWYSRQTGYKKHLTKSFSRCFRRLLHKPGRKSDPEKDNLPGASLGYAATRLEWAEFERLDQFVTLLKKNRDHFPKRSWHKYSDAHQKALLAASAYRTKDPSRIRERQDLLKTALIWEGYAQHFLQDSFASGHIGTAGGQCASDYLSERISPYIPPLGMLIGLLPLACVPGKHVIQHTHDYLNALGLYVIVPSRPLDPDPYQGNAPANVPHAVPNAAQRNRDDLAQQAFVKGNEHEGAGESLPMVDYVRIGWQAFGDRHLFIPEAVWHRLIVEKIVLYSLEEILTSAQVVAGFEKQKTCERWVPVFPVKTGQHPDPDECNPEKKPEDLARFELGRSPDARVPDLPLEGWKILLTLGPAYGRYDQLNANGSLRETRNSVMMTTFEIGYIRSTGPWAPNYYGAGVVIAPGHRTSVYPISLGYWWAPPSANWFIGIRGNVGLRVTEPLTEENPGNHRKAVAETNFPLDIGLEIYPPLALYIRPELFNVRYQGLFEPGTSKLLLDSVLVGRGGLTIGIRYDLGAVLF